MSGNINNKKIMGYTLIELIVVIALIGIVLSVAVPSFEIILRTSEKKELMEFKRDLIFARNSAVMERQTYFIVLDNEKNLYRIERPIKEGQNIIKMKKFVNGIVLKTNNLDDNIAFYPTGSPDKAGTIQLSNKKGERIDITITPATGKVNIKFNK